MSALSLPVPLQAWSAWLNWFSPELALLLGDVVQRMHPLLGRFHGQQAGGVDEPDGVDDLLRKGSYERLLSSEWLLAGELPDEFLRRAASSEHLFLAPRPRAMRRDKLIVAIFDAGPMQLGAPRLAQLALWIVLARRALEVGGALRWGLLHQPGQWHVADGPEDLRRLLRARTFDSAGEAQWLQWQAWLDAQDAGIGERWFIAHDLEMASQSAPTHAVRLRPALDLAAIEVDVQTVKGTRSLQLPLPSPRPATELLRGKFSWQASSHAHAICDERLSLKMAPVISADGLLVAVPLLEGNGAMVFRVPKPGRRAAEKHKRQQWVKGAEPLCATFFGHGFCAVLSGPQKLLFWQLGALGGQPRPDRDALDAPPGSGSLLPVLVLQSAAHLHLFVLDAAGRLVFWVGPVKASAAQTGTRGPMVLDHQVLAMARIDQRRFVYVSRQGDATSLRFAGATGRETTVHPLAASQPMPSSVLLAGGLRWNHGRGACALQVSGSGQPEMWRMHTGRLGEPGQYDTWQVQLPPGDRGVGLVYLERSNDYALVVLAKNRTDLVLHFNRGAEPMMTVAAPVQRITVCPSSGLVAIVCTDRSLHVYGWPDQTLRLAVHSGNSEEA